MVVVYFMCIIFIYECITSRSSSWLVRTYSEVSKNTSRTYSIDSGEQELPIATHIPWSTRTYPDEHEMLLMPSLFAFTRFFLEL